MLPAEPPTTIAREAGPRGEVAVRVRRGPSGPVHELIVAGVFAMDDAETSSEVALAEMALAQCARPQRVLIGGLGLGHTALAVLRDARVREVTAVEIEPALIGWARAGLVPALAAVGADPRVRLVEGDVGAILGREGTAYDVVLLDVDNGPSFLVHERNHQLYGEPALRATLARVAPGGVLVIWAAQREPALLALLGEVAGPDRVSEVVLPIERDGRAFDYALYVVTTPVT